VVDQSWAEPVPVPQHSKCAVCSVALYADQQRTNFMQKMKDIDPSSDIPGAEGFRATTSRLDPVNSSPETRQHLDDVAIRIDNPYHRVSVGADHNASFAEQQSRDHSPIGVGLDSEGATPKRCRPADAKPMYELANRVSVDIERRGDLSCTHSVAVHLADLVLAISEYTATTVRTERNAVPLKQTPQWSVAALVGTGEVIEAGTTPVRRNDFRPALFQPGAHTSLESHDPIIHGNQARWCDAAQLQSFLASRELDGRTWDEYPQARAEAVSR
jgi:hypothetical protein